MLGVLNNGMIYRHQLKEIPPKRPKVNQILTIHPNQILTIENLKSKTALQLNGAWPINHLNGLMAQ